MVGKVTEDMQLAMVSAIPEDEQRLPADRCRSVSRTSILGKCWEELIEKHISIHSIRFDGQRNPLKDKSFLSNLISF